MPPVPISRSSKQCGPGVSLKRRRGRGAGASLVEVTAGLFIIIPLFLCVVNLSAIVLGQIVNDGMAKRAARAAAHKPTGQEADAAANTVVSSYKTNGLIRSMNVVSVDFNNTSSGNVIVETSALIHVPAPMPFLPLFQNERTMHARATEPIVMIPATP